VWFVFVVLRGFLVMAVLCLTANHVGQSVVLPVKLILLTSHWVLVVRAYTQLPAIM